MNNCMLLAEIVQAPQLRYTSDNQLPVAEFVVQFPGLREGDPVSQMKVVGWGNLAQEIQENYQVGQRVLLEGRLGMNTVERPEGYKEKQAELTVQRIYNAGTFATMPMAAPTPLTANAPAATSAAPRPAVATPRPAAPPPSPAADSDPGINYDEIPF
ncbi:single-stranded DNA-binding protein [Phormidium sp. FACHB-1136]|jgi:single-strand DNA-binding protein|uniref:single-stranded DNA-binding protein n=1 Tax=Phormidium sp. FACHB-1136 TaxID=2692848 RepID=UPI00168204D5|nr:single-stranded DNA-binding protein [Phormidium sp. FACHB-1136]MBD2428623.1 single-stranded DNA-binding protein [Phormidium sp. FACHB-1136]